MEVLEITIVDQQNIVNVTINDESNVINALLGDSALDVGLRTNLGNIDIDLVNIYNTAKGI